MKRRTMTFLWAEDMGSAGESRGIVACRDREQRKRCDLRSQYANAVLHLRFVPTRHELDKHLIRLRLDAVSGRA